MENFFSIAAILILVALVLVLATNHLSKKLADSSVW